MEKVVKEEAPSTLKSVGVPVGLAALGGIGGAALGLGTGLLAKNTKAVQGLGLSFLKTIIKTPEGVARLKKMSPEVKGAVGALGLGSIGAALGVPLGAVGGAKLVSSGGKEKRGGNAIIEKMKEASLLLGGAKLLGKGALLVGKPVAKTVAKHPLASLGVGWGAHTALSGIKPGQVAQRLRAGTARI
jgi:hypothetical protein